MGRATTPTMTTLMLSNNNVNKAETQLLPNRPAFPESKQPAKGSIKFWILRVKTPEETGELPLVSREDSQSSFARRAIRSNYMDKSIEAKKKVIRMLFVVVAEFFVCWAPLHVLNTWYLFSPETVYRHVGSTGVSLVHLLAYVSSCCNPITYCFMNHKFRMAFISLFQSRVCWLCGGGAGGATGLRTQEAGTGAGCSDASANDSTLYVGRASRSEGLSIGRETPEGRGSAIYSSSEGAAIPLMAASERQGTENRRL